MKVVGEAAIDGVWNLIGGIASVPSREISRDINEIRRQKEQEEKRNSETSNENTRKQI